MAETVTSSGARGLTVSTTRFIGHPEPGEWLCLDSQRILDAKWQQ